MYVYLGGDTVIRSDTISGIFDMDTSTVNKATRDFLSKAEKENRVVYVNYELPKSFVLCRDNQVFVCPLNTATLLKRIKK